MQEPRKDIHRRKVEAEAGEEQNAPHELYRDQHQHSVAHEQGGCNEEGDDAG